MTQKQEWLFWTLAYEILNNNSPAVYNIGWRLREILRDLGLNRVRYIKQEYDGHRRYYALYSSTDKRAIKRIYEPCNQSEITKMPAIANPYRGGRVSKVPNGVRERVKRYAEDGCSERKIADMTGLSRKQVRYILGRS